MSNDLAVAQNRQGFDLSPQTFDQALVLADYMAKSEMVPKAYRNRPGDCLIAMQWGMEIGLKPLQALQSIAPINGKPNLYGDAGKALLLANGCAIDEDDTEVAKANGRARCKITRPGRQPVQRTFSVEDAKTAGLWNKEGPWRAYPWRQMAWRAFWFAARDAAADLLRGMGGFEEAIDTPVEKHMGPAEVVQSPHQGMRDDCAKLAREAATEAALQAVVKSCVPLFQKAKDTEGYTKFRALVQERGAAIKAAAQQKQEPEPQAASPAADQPDPMDADAKAWADDMSAAEQGAANA